MARGAGAGRSGIGAVTTCVLVAFGLLVALHVEGAAALDPLRDTISDFVFLPGGYVQLGLAAAALAVACLVLAGGLRRAVLPRPDVPAGLLVSGTGALMVVGLFPTHEPGSWPGLASTLHRIGGGWVFAALPVAACMIAARARGAAHWRRSSVTVLTASAWATSGLSAVFLLSYVPIVIFDSPILPLPGVVQRVLYAAVMVTLIVTAWAIHVAHRDAPRRAPADVGSVS